MRTNGRHLTFPLPIVLMSFFIPVAAAGAEPTFPPQQRAEPLPVRGIHIAAPAKGDLDLALEFIRTALPREGANVLILEFGYRFDFKSRPEFSDPSAPNAEDVGRIAAACREKGIELVPQLNCLGHQSWAARTDRLLAKHPELDETPGKHPGNKDIYCRSYCPLHPEVHAVLFPLIDELARACGARSFHVGMDEVFILADPDCPRCRGKDPADLFAGEVKALHAHLKEIGCRTWMWGDRFIDGKATGIGKWEASENGTHRAIDLVPKDIVICDWHYEKAHDTPRLFAGKGFPVAGSPWRKSEVALGQLERIRALRASGDPALAGRALGMVQTTWCGLAPFVRANNDQEAGKEPSKGAPGEAARCFRELFGAIRTAGGGAGATGGARPAAVLLEAEAFGDLGGWVEDSQFMDEMGSPFLLAHGLGVPVADARTTAAVPAAGTYRVWVRTRDWVAPWKAPGAPGRFQVLIGGRPLEATFGVEGAEWRWQDGGAVAIEAGPVGIALHDLTGFEGRCDAVLLLPADAPRPPDGGPELAALRRDLLGLPATPEDGGTYDLVIVGGGIAGTCAALAAARLGVEVALVQDRPVLGGNNSSEVRVWLNGARNIEPWPRIGDIVKELEPSRRAHYGPENTADIYEDDRRIALVKAEKNIRLFLGHRADAVEMDGRRIRSALVRETRTGRSIRFSGKWFTDATGDGCIGRLAGADFEMTSEGHMGPSNLWHPVDAGKPSPFPRCPWALDLSDRPFPGRGKSDGDLAKLGGWYWESGFDRDPIGKAEAIRDWNFRAMYGAWDALKNVENAFPNHRLGWAGYVAGKRESRRLLGDVVLSKEDLIARREYPDGCVPTGWKMDLHLPDPRYEKGFEGDAFISKAHYTDYPQPYWVPYRCLYSRNVPNLFMAGRDISVTHEALGAVRVMRTGGCMGEVVGMAASICKERSADPRGIYESYLPELKALMIRGAGKR